MRQEISRRHFPALPRHVDPLHPETLAWRLDRHEEILEFHHARLGSTSGPLWGRLPAPALMFVAGLWLYLRPDLLLSLVFRL
jgi:hypothetical protein